MKINVSVSTSAAAFGKGDRIIARIAKNEWHTGEVTRAGAKLGIKFDDGATATVGPEDLKDVKLLTTNKKSKKPLTDAEAKPLFAKKEKASKPTKVKVNVGTKAQGSNVSTILKAWGRENGYRYTATPDYVELDNRVFAIQVNEGKPGSFSLYALPSISLDPDSQESLAESKAKLDNLTEKLDALKAKVEKVGGDLTKHLKAEKGLKIPGKKPAKTSTVDHAPDTSYASFIAKLTKEKAEKRITALAAKIERMQAQGMRAARRAEDAGPMDIMWERIEPLRIEKEMLEWFVKNPKKTPPKELMAQYADSVLQEHRTNQYKAEREEKAAAFPNLVGWTIEFKARGGRTVTATVLKQLPGKWTAAPRYKAQEPGMTSTWTVSDGLVTKKTKPANLNNVLDTMTKKADAKSQNKKALAKVLKASIGGEITWTSARQGGSIRGRITAVGPSKVKATALDSGGDWRIPIDLITHIGGQDIAKGVEKLKPAKPLVETGLFMTYNRQGQPLMKKPGTKAEAEKSAAEYLKNNMRTGVMVMTRPVYK